MFVSERSRAKRRVVIVDDSLTMSALLEHAFESHGAFDVVGIARDAAAALTMIRDRKPDLVTIDLCMPYIDGAQLLNDTAELDDVCKIVVSDMVGTSPRVQARLEQSGAAACISKRVLAQDRRAFFLSVLATAERFDRARRNAAQGTIEVVDSSARGGSALMLRRNYPIPVDEARRQEVLHSKRLLNAERERSFDLLASHAARAASFPIGLVSFIDNDCQWIKASHGVELMRTDRAHAFCAHTICQDGPLIIRNATRDPRFADSPLVTGAPFIKTYVGQAITARDGTRLGALCLIDQRSRIVTADQLSTLRDLALLAGEMVEQRATMN